MYWLHKTHMQWPGVEERRWPSYKVVRLSHRLHQWPCWWTQLVVERPSMEKEGSSFERKSFHWPSLPPHRQLGCGVKTYKYTHVQAYMYNVHMYMSSLFNSLGAYLTRRVNFKSLGVVDSNGVPWYVYVITYLCPLVSARVAGSTSISAGFW